jgi:AcrR family transcriptional regulator
MVEAASALFAERGFGGVSMDDIAKASGITKPMLYAYFDSKEGLFAACAEVAGEDLRDQLREVSERRELPPDQRLWEGIDRLFTFVEENHDSWLLLYPEGALASGSIGSGAAAARDETADLLTELFKRTAQEQGLSDQALAHIEGIAHTFTAATISAASRWAAHEDEPRDVAALRLMNLLWMGCGALLEGRLWLPGQPS